jgi:hypothetical protein
MASSMRFEDDRLYTRQEVRKAGLSYSSTQFQRWEATGRLIPVKPNGRSSRVHYWGANLNDFLGTRS